MNRKFRRGAVLLALIVVLGMSGAVVAQPTTPCTTANFGAKQIVDSFLYQCLGQWERIGYCDDRGQCILY